MSSTATPITRSLPSSTSAPRLPLISVGRTWICGIRALSVVQ
jgi:hypothetical protein